jgi:hypothetical protein
VSGAAGRQQRARYRRAKVMWQAAVQESDAARCRRWHSTVASGGRTTTVVRRATCGTVVLSGFEVRRESAAVLQQQ